MVVKFKGAINYQDGEKIEFEIDENDEIKCNYVGEFMYEPANQYGLIQSAIQRVTALLKTCSPVKFEMKEILKEEGVGE